MMYDPRSRINHMSCLLSLLIATLISFNEHDVLCTACASPPDPASIPQSEDRSAHDMSSVNTKTRRSAEMAFLDLDLIITAQERTDWILDQPAILSLLPRGAEVVCQLTPEAQDQLSHMISDRLHDAGSSQKLWRSDLSWGSKRYTEHARALHLERVSKLYQETLRIQRDCPYWLPPREDFLGVHRDVGRVQLIAETMGGGQIQLSDGDLNLGGAAQGRVLTIFGLDTQWGLALGIEGGIASTFPKDRAGQRNVKAQWTLGVPLMIRGWSDNLRIDGEIAAIARFSDDLGRRETQANYGVRFAAGVGLSTLRIFGVLPHLMVWGGSETYFSSTLVQVFRLGTRIGVSL